MPIFGNTDIGDIGTTLHATGWCYMVGYVATPSSNGELQSITMRLYEQTVDNSGQCALYERAGVQDAGNLIATTNEVKILSTDDNSWKTLDFPDPKPNIVGGVSYFIVARTSTDNVGITQIARNNDIEWESWWKFSDTPIPFDSPMTDEAGGDYYLCMYGTYTESTGDGTTTSTFTGTGKSSTTGAGKMTWVTV